jgi:hypothetical protein
MKCVLEMASCGTIYIPNFMKIVRAFKQFYGFNSAI